MKIFLSMGIAIPLLLTTLSPLWAQTLLPTPNITLAKQVQPNRKVPIAEKSAGYYQLMSNAMRTLSKEEAVRLYKLAKSKVPNLEGISENQKLKLIKAAEDGLKNVDKINFQKNREVLAKDLEDLSNISRSRGREKDAQAFQRRAAMVRSGKVKNIFEVLDW
jgi:hypothetical protein